MSKYPRFVVLSGMLLFVLLVSLASPVSVYADDGAPPPPATEEPVQPPEEVQPPAEDEGETEVLPEEANGLSPVAEGEEPVATEAPVVEEAVATEAPAATEVPVEEADGVSPIVESEGEEVSEEPGAIEELTVGEVLEAAPEGTEVVVLDENGEALPLVSTEAAQIVQSGDPMWCPAGASPMASTAGCTNSYSSLADLLNFLITFQADPTYDQAGVIWIRNDYNSSTAEAAGITQFVMQGGALNPFSHMSPYALTMQGGWMGDSAGTINHGDPSTLDGDALQIINWTGSITIRDVEFLDTGAIGLVVETQGDITLSNVDANGNTVAGADLDSGGNIDIRSSIFGGGAGSGNDFMGLSTSTVGSTTLVDVTSSGNGLFGVILSGPAGFGGPITVSESHFDENGALGLMVSSGSSITLSDVTASDNAGAFVGLAGANLVGDGPITVTESHFDSNSTGGLLVVSKSEVSLSDVTANGNGFFGAIMDTTGRVWVSNSYFDGNTDPLGEAVGLAIGSDQSITLDHVSASNNLNGDGVLLDSLGDAAIICSVFNSNPGIGVDGFLVDGTFTLNDVTFSGNGMDYDGTPVITSGGCKIVKGKSQGHKLLSSLPLHIVPVNGGEQIELNCHAYSGTKLILPNGDRVILPCPIKDHGVLTGKTQSQLPAPLNTPFGFASAMEVQIIRDGEPVSETHAGMTIDFVIPDGMQDAHLAILRWDALQSQWVEVTNGYDTHYGRFVATSNFTGIYVLVTK